VLDAGDMQRSRTEIDLVPAPVRQLRNAQAVVVSDQNHGGIAVVTAIGGFGALGDAAPRR
jgi:hypothetical protein